MERNKFGFYDDKKFVEERKRCTRLIELRVKTFVEEMQEFLRKYQHIGADDTESREMVAEYIKKEIII